MSSSVGYRVVKFHSPDAAGATVVATRDYLPGEIVLEEKEPLMFVPTELLRQDYLPGAKHDMNVFLASYIAFRKLDAHKQRTFLKLPSPAIGAAEDRIRDECRGFRYRFDSDKPPRYLTPQEMDTMVKVFNVMKINICGRNDGKTVFSEFSNFHHSCTSNCSFSGTDSGGMRVRTIKPVSVGEEMTISCYPDRDTLPTHVRRHKLLEGKEFTCHCPRCDAPGDDTRQFDCFDPACKGVMMVCQPINTDKLLTRLAYFGVEYMEPHLLPCTECHRAAPTDYQTKMLALEKQLPRLLERFAREKDDALEAINSKPSRFGPCLALQTDIQSLSLPSRHQLAVPILHIAIIAECFLLQGVVMGRVSRDLQQCRAAVQRAAHCYIAAQEAVTPGVHVALGQVLYNVCHDCIMQLQKSTRPGAFVFPPLQAKALLQRLLRLMLVLNGRDGLRQANVDEALGTVFEALPPAELSTQLCAFCEESPTNAFMKRSRCGACKKVMYCSVGCQKAHWKLHKKTCKVEKK